MELGQYTTVRKENQMYDYRIFFFAIALIGGIAAGIAAVCSVNCQYRAPIKPAYGDTSWSAIDELEEL